MLGPKVRAALELLKNLDESEGQEAEVDRALKGRKVHISPLQKILRFLKKIPYELERWEFKDGKTPHLQIPPGLFPSRADAVRSALADQTSIQVFADGSRSDLGVGGAAVLRIDGVKRACSGAKLGIKEQCSSLEAELAGILCATRILTRLTKLSMATIYSDSQIAVACVKGEASGAPKALLDAIRSDIEEIEDREDCILFSLLWCPGHRDVAGSTEADLEAKAAARGKHYRSDLVPEFLAEYKPIITRHTAKVILKETNRDFALSNWADSLRGLKMQEQFPR
ncbi:hypothetical protein FRC09_016444, partial [Ceratobasidium sp. 395]